MGEVGELLGWITAISFGISLLNYFIKFINKRYINKMDKNNELVKYYRVLMKYIVRYHRLFGTTAVIALAIHFLVIYIFGGVLSITGLISGIFMLLIFLLGIIGTFVIKNNRGSWVKIHRTLSFMLIIFIAMHLIFKR